MSKEHISLSAAILAYLGSCEERNCEPATLRSYRGTLDSLTAHVGESASLQSLSTKRLNAFLRSLDLKPSSKAKVVTHLKGFFKYANRQGLLTSSPAELLDRPRFKLTEEREPYTADEVDSILATCRSPHERALVLLMLHTGLRVSDAVAFRSDKLKDGCAWVRAKKNGREVPVMLPAAVLGELRVLSCGEWLFAANGQPPSLKAWQHTLERIYRESGVAGAINHRFRHTLCSRLLANGATIHDCADILGISSQVAEHHYSKWTQDRMERIKWLTGILTGD